MDRARGAVNAADTLAKIKGAGYLHKLITSKCLPSQLSWHAQVVEAAALRRKALEIATRVRQMAMGNADPDDLLAGIANQAVALTALANDGFTSERPLTSLSLLEDFVDEAIEPYNWVIPGLIEHGERLVLTAPEGVGKSVLARQVAMLVAAGRHPLMPRIEIPRKRSLLVDLENPPNLIRRNARGQVHVVPRHRPQPLAEDVGQEPTDGPVVQLGGRLGHRQVQ